MVNPTRQENALSYLLDFNGVQQNYDDILYMLYSDRYQYRQGDVVKLTLLVANTGNDTEVFTFRTSQHYDFLIKGEDKTVWRWSKGKFFLQAIQRKLLRPEEMQVIQENWVVPANLPAGFYIIEGQHLTEENRKLYLIIEVTD